MVMVSTPELRHAHSKVSQRLGGSLNPGWQDFVVANGGTRDEAFLLASHQFMRWSIAEQTFGNFTDLSPGEQMQSEAFYRQIYGGDGLDAHWYRIVARPSLNPDVVRIIDGLLARHD